MRDLASSVEYPSLTANASASNSNLRLRMFMPSFMSVSIGARASENRMKPTMMGNTLWKPKDW